MYASNNRKEKRKNLNAQHSSFTRRSSILDGGGILRERDLGQCNFVSDNDNRILNFVHRHHHRHHPYQAASGTTNRSWERGSSSSSSSSYSSSCSMVGMGASSASGGGSTRGGGRGRVYDQDTKRLNFMCPSIYREETFKFLYDFFTKTENPESLYASEKGMCNILDAVIEYSSETLRAFMPSTLSDYVQQESAQVMIIDQTLLNQNLMESLRSFPTIPLVHESLSTCPFALSECTMTFFILVIEVKIGLLYRQHVVNKWVDNVSVLNGNPKVIADEDIFCHLKSLWRNYVIRERHNPNKKLGSGVLRHISVCTTKEKKNTDDNNDDSETVEVVSMGEGEKKEELEQDKQVLLLLL